MGIFGLDSAVGVIVAVISEESQSLIINRRCMRARDTKDMRCYEFVLNLEANEVGVYAEV